MSKRIKLVLILQLISFVIVAQNKFYVEVSGTMPFIPDLKKSPNYFEMPFPYTGGTVIMNSYNLVEHYKFKPGISLNFGVQRKVKDRIGINLGLGFSYYNYNRSTYLDADNSGLSFIRGRIINNIFVPDNESTTNESNSNPDYGQSILYYFTIPLNLKYDIFINKFSIDAGIVNSILAYSSQLIPYAFYNGTRYEEIDSGYGLSNYLLGFNVSLKYKIFDKLWLSASYKHSTTPTYIESERFGGDAKYKLVDFGFKYYL